ncbi:MAG: amidohydrolase family protein, partial [Phototrophicaceae bacterium]
MKQVDYILSGGTVVTMNESFDVFRDGAVAILGDEIVAVGERETILRDYSAAEVLDCTGTYITPGLINAHTHVPMTLLRGLADDLRLDVWLMGYIMPTEREFVNPSFVRLGTKIACAEMIRGGVTAFADMYYFEKDIAAATAEVGMRALCGESILKFPSPDAESYEDSLAYIEEYLQEWQGHPLIRPALAPHAPYSNTEETLRRTTELAAKYNAPMMIHVAETQEEQDDNMRDYGQTVVRWMKSLGM